MALDPEIDTLLMSGLPATAVTIIRRRLAYLATMFANDEPKSGEQNTWLSAGNLCQLLLDAADGAEPQRPDWLVMGAIKDEAKVRGSKSRFPFLAALLATRPGDDPLSRKHEEAVALCIAGGLHAASLWGSDDPATAKAVIEAARAAQQLATPDCDPILASMPSLVRDPFLLQALLGHDVKKARLYAGQEGEPDIAMWLANREPSEPRKQLCSLVGKLKFGRRAITAPNRGAGSHKSRTPMGNVTKTIAASSTLIPRSACSEGPPAFNSPTDNEADPNFRISVDAGQRSANVKYDDDTRPTLESPGRTRTHLHSKSVCLHRTHASAMARDMARRAMHLPCESASATQQETHVFSRVIFSRLSKLSIKDLNYEGLFYAALSLVLGRPPSALSMSYSQTRTSEPGFSGTLSDRYVYQQGVVLPKLAFGQSVSKILRAVPEELIPLPLHSILATGLEAYVRGGCQTLGLDLNNHDDCARRALKSLSNDLPRPWTLSRVCGVLPAALHQMGADRAHAAWILGERPMDAPPTNYSQINQDDVIATYRRALKRSRGAEGPKSPTCRTTIGSRIILTDRAVGAFIQKLCRATRNEGTPFNVAHNQIAVQTYTILALATGHRPVRSPFERLHDFDLASGWVIINDKAIGSASSRLVPLAPTAISCVKLWVDYLSEIAASQRKARPDLAARADAALDNSRPLLFLMDSHAPTQFTPSAVQEIMRPTLPLPANWTRHMTSTILRQTDLSPDIIDACLGHDGLSVGHQSRASPLSHAHLRAFADKIEGWFMTIGLGSSSNGKN